MKTIILDDYNQSIPKEQDVIGAVTTTWGHLALRNRWKIIEIIEIIEVNDVLPKE